MADGAGVSDVVHPSTGPFDEQLRAAPSAQPRSVRRLCSLLSRPTPAVVHTGQVEPEAVTRTASRARSTRSPHRRRHCDQDACAGAEGERRHRAVGARRPAPNALGHILIVGRGHLERTLKDYITHYNAERPHRSLALACSARGSPRRAGPPPAVVARPRGARQPDPRVLRRRSLSESATAGTHS